MKKRSEVAKNKYNDKNSPEYIAFEKALGFSKILGDGHRIKIIRILKEKPMYVNEIREALDIPQNLTSHHLLRMKKFGILTSEKSGTFVKYEIDKKFWKENVDILKGLLKK